MNAVEEAAASVRVLLNAVLTGQVEATTAEHAYLAGAVDVLTLVAGHDEG